MGRNWFFRLFGRASGATSWPSQASLPLDAALDAYRQALETLNGEPPTWLSVLLARDRVEAARQKSPESSPETVRQLLDLDAQLLQRVTDLPEDTLTSWRRTLRPPESHWWWYPEREREQSDLPWILLAGTLTTLTLPLAVEIIRRLWDGAPDTVSVLGTLLTLLLTGSPFTQRGREFTRWLLRRIPLLVPHLRAQAMAAMALLAFLLMLVGRLLVLPPLATAYNESGLAALQAGDLTAAQRRFRRAVALNPDFAVGYYHVANVYEEIGQPEEAIAWYRRALARDLNLAPAYSNLGRLHLLQDNARQAVRVLRAGLRRATGEMEADRLTRYRLLSYLGWAYVALEQPVPARRVLEEAVALEETLDADLRSAVPHYYLALTYETLAEPEAALRQWEDCLRYLDPESPDQIGWEETIHAHLETLREVNQR